MHRPDDQASASWGGTAIAERLLERDAELAQLGRAIAALATGAGGVLLVEGPAGIGKTALLAEARRRAGEAGATVLHARGGELERDFPYGVVRQLFEHVLGEELLAGAAALAAPVFAHTALRPSADAFAVLHGLYWLTINLAGRGPLVLVLDDAHWADAPSLRFLLYLARRLEGAAVLVLLGLRSDEHAVDRAVLADLAAQPVARTLRLAPLSAQAVGTLLAPPLPGADERFVSACHAATGGTPYLVHELAHALAADGVAPVAAAADRVREFGPATVAHATLLRLARLPAGAAPLANAIAVLGGEAQLHRALRLADVSETEALIAVDALVRAHLLDAGPPLAFAHPIVRAAVYAQLGPGARSAAHARAAQLLADEGTDVDTVAAHLLLTEPRAHPGCAETLRAAAQQALARGAPEIAARYLQRALEEGGDRARRCALTHELGLAQKATGHPDAVASLQAALALADDPCLRAQIGFELGEIFLFTGRWDCGVGLLERSVADLGGVPATDPLSLRVHTLWANAAAFDARLCDRLAAAVPALREAAEGGGAAGRELLLWLASRARLRGEPDAAVRPLLDRGLDGGRFVASESPGLSQAVGALAFHDALDDAAALSEAMLTDARTRGTVLGFTAANAARAYVQARRGRLAEAEADVRAALELAQEHALLVAIPVSLWYGADALLERPQLDDVALLVRMLQLPSDLEHTMFGAWLQEVRGRLRLLDRDIPGAIADLRACGATLAALGQDNPNVYRWRSELARAMAATEPAEARALAAAELEQARRIGVARGIGTALCALGAVTGGADGIERLREAVAVLEHSPARLEHARALVELGAALRRANQRTAAREPLRQGLALAGACDAGRLAELARSELTAAGARPRREALSGVASLTPSERRVAALAATGLSNREVAQALFVSLNTVETHLRHVYAKLRIQRRGELAGLLGE